MVVLLDVRAVVTLALCDCLRLAFVVSVAKVVGIVVVCGAVRFAPAPRVACP